MPARRRRTLATWLAACLMGAATLAVAAAPGHLQDEDRNPEAGSGYLARAEVWAPRYMMVTAHPLATQAGRDVLRAGGSAMDAAIAAQLVLNLVEPQSSGIGGGAFVVHYRHDTGALDVYDGRETAPASATAERFMRDGRPLPFLQAVNSGLSVGVPGVLRALEMGHRAHGVLPWRELFQPAITIAEQGFAITPRLHRLIAGNADLRRQPATAAYFLDGQGRPWPVGHVLRTPAYADTLRRIAAGGAQAFYTGPIARDIVAAVRGHARPGDLTLADLASYQAKRREALCGAYRSYRICGAPPPSSGVLGVLQLLGILQHYPMAAMEPDGLQAVHYFSEAGRLTYADRGAYVADPDFVPVPVRGLLDPAYLAQRAALIDPQHSMGEASPGVPRGVAAPPGDHTAALPSTTHLVAVDAQGNVVSMTSSLEFEFGSKIMVRGFLLNNQLTDFSRQPVDEAGRLEANRVQAGKRPRSTMAPLIVFRHGQPYIALGAPGGNAIINFVARTLVGVLDWGQSLQQAIAGPNYGSRNRQTDLERGTALEALAQPLRAMGHEVGITSFPSGLHGIMIEADGLRGGVDPRREGRALGG